MTPLPTLAQDVRSVVGAIDGRTLSIPADLSAEVVTAIDLVVEFEGPTTFDGHMWLFVFLEDIARNRVPEFVAELQPLLDPKD